jgi:hypothetical protein
LILFRLWSTYIYFRIHVKPIIDGFEINLKKWLLSFVRHGIA